MTTREQRLTEICRVNIPEGRRGHWYIEKFTVPENDSRAFSYAMQGKPVPPGTYTRLMRDHSFDNPMMSDTPSEVYDLIKPFAEAKQRGGRILINGLGLGVFLKGILSLPNVTHVDVVEIETSIIELVGPTYTPDTRVHIHHADAYTKQWGTEEKWSVVWHGIWPNICSDNLKEMARLHRKYSRKADWQGSWCKSLCQYYQRKER